MCGRSVPRWLRFGLVGKGFVASRRRGGRWGAVAVNCTFHTSCGMCDEKRARWPLRPHLGVEGPPCIVHKRGDAVLFCLCFPVAVAVAVPMQVVMVVVVVVAWRAQGARERFRA